MFFVLYPLGIGSETWLVYRAIPHAAAVNPLLGYLLWAVLAIYVPGKQLFLPSLLPTDAGRLVRSLHAHDGAAPAGHAGQGEGARVNGDGVRGVAATRGLWTAWQHAVYQGLHAIQWCSLPLLGSYKYINNPKKQTCRNWQYGWLHSFSTTSPWRRRKGLFPDSATGLPGRWG